MSESDEITWGGLPIATLARGTVELGAEVLAGIETTELVGMIALGAGESIWRIHNQVVGLRSTIYKVSLVVWLMMATIF